MSSKGKRAAKDAKRTAEWLQATVALASGEALSAFGLALDKTGCQILERPADSPLAKAGLKVNDLLLRIDGQPRRDLADLKKPRKLAGKTMEVKYVRNQQREKAHVR
jgi:S1-C subfamily serine protease